MSGGIYLLGQEVTAMDEYVYTTFEDALEEIKGDGRMSEDRAEKVLDGFGRDIVNGDWPLAIGLAMRAFRNAIEEHAESLADDEMPDPHALRAALERRLK